MEGSADQTVSGTYGVRANEALGLRGSGANSRAVLAGSGDSHVSVGTALQMVDQYVRFELPAGMADGDTYITAPTLNCNKADIDVTAPGGLNLAVGGQVVLVDSAALIGDTPATNALTIDGATYALEVNSQNPTHLILKKTADAPQPALSASPAALDYGDITVGKSSAAQSVTVTAANLTEDIALTEPNGFTITKDAGWNDRTGGTLQVVFNPAQTGAYAGDLQVTSGGRAATVSLSGTGVEQPPVDYTITAGGRGARTADDSSIALWIVLLLIAGTAITGGVLYRNRKTKA